MSRQSDLAGSLATVAIAALGGPLFVARAALGEVVKYAQSRYDENEQSRQIRRQVAGAVTAWADSEKLTRDDVDLGLALAAELVARFGPDNDTLAGLGFDPVHAADAVVAAAKAEDPRWETEDHYAVAVRGIGVTYEALTAQLRAREGTAISVFLALRGSIEDYAARAEERFRDVAIGLGDLADALAGLGTVAEVMSYLRARIADWDVSVWHPDWKASALERLVLVREKTGQLLGSEEALAGEQMLVVLGGPGAGKTWLARRYARQAAQEALSQLEDGARLDEVELPLLTTWEQWAKTPGSPTQSLVASSFASGLGHRDAGGPDTAGRLERTFLRPEARVLLIVDSLDEAADRAAQGPRLYELQGLPSLWRIVVTSRPAAWGSAYRGGTGSRTPRVVRLHDLSYPHDVESFIRGWFTADPGRRDALVREIRSRPEVARTAVVPLMLTFYCLLAEEPKGMTTPLPARRRELYRRLVRRLLGGAWTANPSGPDAAPDWDYCEELLRGWAWAAVRDRTNAAGLGVWDDSFTQPTTVRQPERRAIDHIAPKTAADDEGYITRRFVHRTFLEHFVAEHVATMDTKTAAETLLPHLWFDPDWQVAAPAAVVAHNQQQKGALLQHILTRAMHPAADSARLAAHRELEGLLLAIAQESEPYEWAQEHQDLLNGCRVTNAIRMPDLVTRSTHWNDSNPHARMAVLQAISASEIPWKADELAEIFPGLAPTTGEQAQARFAVLQAMSAAEVAWQVSVLVKVLQALGPTDVEQAQARRDVLRAVSAAREPWQVGALLVVLPALGPTDGELAEARMRVPSAVSAAEETGQVRVLCDLVKVLLSLAPTNDERMDARRAVMRALALAEEPGQLHDFVEVLPLLTFTDGERAQIRKAILRELSPKAEPLDVIGLVAVLLSLTPSERERAQARRAVLRDLSANGELWKMSDLVKVLLSLTPSERERAQARRAVLRDLTAAEETSQIGDLVEVMTALAPTGGERAQALTAVLKAVSATKKPWVLSALVEVMLSLGPSEGERAQALTAVLKAVSATKKPWNLSALVEVMLSLGPSEGERAQALTAVLQALSAEVKTSFADTDLVRVLLSLGPSEGKRAQARTAVLQALSAANELWILSSLVRVLLSLGPSEGERAQARRAVQTLSANAEPGQMGDLVEVLLSLTPSEGERAQARTAVLQTLSAAGHEGEISTLGEVLRSVSSTDSWLAWLASNE